MTELLSLPLRERKRVETWTAVHNAATELTLSKGLHSVTVEAIAEQANISSRTFFNYFSTKEDAILGLQEPSVEGHVRDDFAVSGSLLDSVAKLLLTVSQSTFGGDRTTSRRFEVLKHHPELMQRRISYIAKVETLVAGLVEERLASSAGWPDGLEDVPPADIAQVLVLTASAAMRFAMQQGTPPDTATQYAALDQATTLFRKTLRNSI